MKDLNRWALTIAVIMTALFLFLSGCTAMTQRQREGLTSVGASASGYYMGKKKPEIIPDFLEWSEKVLVFLDTETPMDADLKHWMQVGLDKVVDDEYLQFHFKNLLKIFDLDLETEIQVPEVLTEEYKSLVKGALAGFKEGLLQAKKLRD